MALNPEVSKIARQKIGLYLRDIRKDKGLSMYRVAMITGMKENQVADIENGKRAYTIDSFLAYVSALDCYFYLANKDGKENDLDHLVKKSDDPA